MLYKQKHYIRPLKELINSCFVVNALTKFIHYRFCLHSTRKVQPPQKVLYQKDCSKKVSWIVNALFNQINSKTQTSISRYKRLFFPFFVKTFSKIVPLLAKNDFKTSKSAPSLLFFHSFFFCKTFFQNSPISKES